MVWPVTSISLTLWFIRIAVEIVLTATYFIRLRRKFPVFTSYCCIASIESVFLFSIRELHGPYFTSYYIWSVVEAGFQFACIAEIFAVLFRPYRTIPTEVLGWFCAVTCLLIFGGSCFSQWIGHHNSDVLFGACRVFERTLWIASCIALACTIGLSCYFRLPWRRRLSGICAGMCFQLASITILLSLLPNANEHQCATIGIAVSICSLITVLIWLRTAFIKETLTAQIGPEELARLLSILDRFKSVTGRISDAV